MMRKATSSAKSKGKVYGLPSIQHLDKKIKMKKKEGRGRKGREGKGKEGKARQGKVFGILSVRIHS